MGYRRNNIYGIEEVNGTFKERYEQMPFDECCFVDIDKTALIEKWKRQRALQKERTLAANRRDFVEEMIKVRPALKNHNKKDILAWVKKNNICQ